MAKRVIIFGAGDTGKKAFHALGKQYEIAAFADNGSGNYGKKLFGLPVISPEEISSYNVELLIIASVYHVEIAKQLYSMGLKNMKLFWPSEESGSYTLLELYEGDPFSGCIYKKPDVKHGGGMQRIAHRGDRKKVLVIAYYFPPVGGSAVQRTLKFVKYLREYGYEPVVLTTKPDPGLDKYSMDASLLPEIPEDIQVVRVKDDFSWPDVISKGKAQEITEFLYSIAGSEEWMGLFLEAQKTQPRYILPDKLILWANECVRHVEEYVDMKEIDLIYSTAPYWSPHLAAYFLKQRYGICWVADYRDPWVSNRDYVKLYYPWMTEKEVALDRQLEKKLVKAMDLIVVAGGKWADDFVEGYGVPSSKIREITNGYDEEDFAKLDVKTEKNSKFTLCYNGAVGYNRNPIPVLQVLNSMIERNVLRKDEIRWIFNGAISGDYAKKMAANDQYHIVVQNGMLPHRDSLQISMDSDVMVMYGEPGEKGYLNYPGKFYEYLRIGKPILCFSSDRSFQADVLKETGLGVNMDLYDLKGIEAFLKKRVAAWRNGREPDLGSAEAIRKYERKNLTRMLADGFDNVLGSSGNL